MDHTEEQGPTDAVGFMEKAAIALVAVVAAGLIYLSIVAVMALERVAP